MPDDHAEMPTYVTFRPEVWQPLANQSQLAGWSAGQRRKKKQRGCPTAGCEYRLRRLHTQLCPSDADEPPGSGRISPATVRCDEEASRIGASGVRLLLGVHTGPKSVDRRAGIRATWMNWQRTTSTLVCFLLGRQGVGQAVQRQVEAEAASHRDVLWLRFNASEGARPRLTIAKAAAWWQAAAAMLGPGSATLVGRADDDSFVVLPRLAAVVANVRVEGSLKQPTESRLSAAWRLAVASAPRLHMRPRGELPTCT